MRVAKRAEGARRSRGSKVRVPPRASVSPCLSISPHLPPSLPPQAREAELKALRAGAPMGGYLNGGSYCFAMLPANLSYVASQLTPGHEEQVAFIDAENPDRSSWCRYINHAGSEEAACNVDSLVNRSAALVWFVARRDIAAGEELCFDYQ